MSLSPDFQVKTEILGHNAFGHILAEYKAWQDPFIQNWKETDRI